MDTFIGIVALVTTTIVALFGALALQALLLRATVALMQPATASRRMPASAILPGTQLATGAHAKAR
jgi:hypothetical protein